MITQLRTTGPAVGGACCQMCCELRQHIYLLCTCRVRATRKAKETRPTEKDGHGTPSFSATSGLSVALPAAALSFVDGRGSVARRAPSMDGRASGATESGGRT